MSVDTLANILIEQGLISSRQEYHDRIETKLIEIMRLVFMQVHDKLDKKFGCFELFGFDFMIDSNLNPFLIEINTNPALFTDTTV